VRVEPTLSCKVLSSAVGPSRIDVTTEPSLAGAAGAAAVTGSKCAGGPLTSEPLVVAKPVEFLTHKAGFEYIASAAYLQRLV
jgi:hypothetical protein